MAEVVIGVGIKEAGGSDTLHHLHLHHAAVLVPQGIGNDVRPIAPDGLAIQTVMHGITHEGVHIAVDMAFPAEQLVVLVVDPLVDKPIQLVIGIACAGPGVVCIVIIFIAVIRVGFFHNSELQVI